MVKSRPASGATPRVFKKSALTLAAVTRSGSTAPVRLYCSSFQAAKAEKERLSCRQAENWV